MPCIKCSNGKWKYGEGGNCQFDTLETCKQAATAIHIQEEAKKPPKKRKPGGAIDIQPEGPHVPAMPTMQGKSKVITPVNPIQAASGTYNRPPPAPMPSKPMKVPKPKPPMPKGK
jgi:hypothetical protein